jgi:proline dehydrogenase
MPGEDDDAAISALSPLAASGIGGIVTRLGENITDRSEADRVVPHYLTVLDRIRGTSLDIHVSVKLTQLGLDLGEGACVADLETLADSVPA